MLKLAFRSIFRHYLRTGLTLAAIMFGVTGLVLSGGFVEDIFYQLRENTIHSQLGHMQIYKAEYSSLGRRDPYKYLIDDPQKSVARLSALSDVSDVMMRLNFSGLLNNGRADLPIIGEGIEAEKEARLGSALTIIDGRQLAEGDDFGILLGQGVAQALQLKAGSYATLLVNTADGALNILEFEVVGVFRSFSKDFDDHAVRISLMAAQELLFTQGVHSFVISLDQSDATDVVADQVRTLLPASEFEVFTWYELADFYKQTVEMYRRQFGVLQLIILVLVLLSVANSVGMAVYERTGEFGTLMALGNRRKRVFAMILLENAILGLIGALAGVVLGVALAWLISRVGIPMPPPPNSNSGYTAYIQIVPSVITMAFGVGVIATFLAAIIPARRASRIPVVDALRYNI